MKKVLSTVILMALVCLMLVGCSSGSSSSKSDASKAILVISFGTSYNESRDATIGAVEKAVATAYPDYDVRRAFTSQIIIDILAERENLEIDNVDQAMERLVADGVKNLIVQPTHLMNGFEYDDLVKEVMEYEAQFDSLIIGKQLLDSDADFAAVIDVITAETASYSDDDTAIIFMGHGTEHDSNHVYEDLQEKLTAAGFPNYFIGTVEAEPTLDDVIAKAKSGGFSKVVLEPLMVVAGDHANNDMAGDEEDSWKTVFEEQGFEVECVLKGLGQFDGIQKVYIQHIQDSIDKL